MNKVNQQRCWICGSAANSAEHRLKKSDVVRAYGRGPYRDNDEILHFREGANKEPIVLQGPNARSLKYSPNLCHRCNTTKTQPFDRAYDSLMEWLTTNGTQVLQRRFIIFQKFMGINLKVLREIFLNTSLKVSVVGLSRLGTASLRM